MSGPVWDLGDGLPPAPEPRGAYQPVAVHGTVARTAGMTPRLAGELTVVGRVGEDVDLDRARRAAALATANALAAVAAAAGGIGQVERILGMTVWIAAVDGFTAHSAVADGGSEVIAAMVDGPAPARAAVGVASLPGGSPVEVALVAALRQAASPAGATR